MFLASATKLGQCQDRALLFGLQQRIGKKIDARERIVSFIPEYVAYLLNRLNQGEDGKVPYERIRGKKPTILGLEFGEKLLYKIRRGPKLEKIKEDAIHEYKDKQPKQLPPPAEAKKPSFE